MSWARPEGRPLLREDLLRLAGCEGPPFWVDRFMAPGRAVLDPKPPAISHEPNWTGVSTLHAAWKPGAIVQHVRLEASYGGLPRDGKPRREVVLPQTASR